MRSHPSPRPPLLLRPALLGLAFAGAFLLAGCSDDDGPTGPAPGVSLSFQKAGGPAQWTGTISGDFEGDLTTNVQSSEEENGVLHVRFLWIVDAGDDSFTADLAGTLDLGTGVTETDGEIIQAEREDLMGARVEERGQAVASNPQTGATAFEGTLGIFP